MYRYIQIGSDARFSQSLGRERIINTLRSFSEIEEDKRHCFKNSGGTPWLRINISICDPDGNYPGMSAPDSEQANMVELICLDKGDEKTWCYYQEFANAIATRINWRIITVKEN